MTKDANKLDLSFLDEDEADSILQVLERDEMLRRAEKERLSKLQKPKREMKWFQALTGQWFEDMQKKKYRNETDINSLVKQPLTYRVKKKTREDQKLDQKFTRSKSQPVNSDETLPVTTRRSPLSLLFSFRKQRAKQLEQQIENANATELSSELQDIRQVRRYMV
ncbi:exophilin-5 [Protopterus annectens]|uniref:exophilin-5 n=1 Tax=Protopterus annectens TaxID=7888 RepID=UPI001CFBEC6D|nr:exophilin-5 [Protopterus annectens]